MKSIMNPDNKLDQSEFYYAVCVNNKYLTIDQEFKSYDDILWELADNAAQSQILLLKWDEASKLARQYEGEVVSMEFRISSHPIPKCECSVTTALGELGIHNRDCPISKEDELTLAYHSLEEKYDKLCSEMSEMLTKAKPQQDKEMAILLQELSKWSEEFSKEENE